MSIEIPEIKCSIIIEHLSNNGSMMQKSSITNGLIRLCRNNSGDCVLVLINNNKNNKSNETKRYTFSANKGNYQLNIRFVAEGKCSILLNDYNVRIFISNCPSNDLSLFLKGFSIKCSNKNDEIDKNDSMLFRSNIGMYRLNKSRMTNIEKISPLTGNDFIKAISFRDRTNIQQKHEPKQLIPSLKTTESSTSPLAMKNKTLHKRKLDTILEKISTTSPKTKRKMLSSAIPSPVRALKVLNATNLTDDQSKVVSAVLNGENVFFTGSAGTGKSYLLKFIIGRLPPATTFVTASTGIAACQINGITLHLFAGIPANWLELSAQEIVKRLYRNESKLQRWKNCKCLIIDEISMVSGEYFEKLDNVARIIRRKNSPFGGIQLVICGDFLQLPPIIAKRSSIFPNDNKNNAIKKTIIRHTFQTNAWKNAIKYYFELRKIQRQTDKEFIEILQLIRIGKINENVRRVLQKATEHDLRMNTSIIPTQLYPLRHDVDTVNKTQLMKIESKSYYFKAEDSNNAYSDVLDTLCPTPRQLELKIGAQVMLNKNIDIQQGLVNGMAGKIINFECESSSSQNNSQQQQNLLPRIRFINGVETIIKPDKWSYCLQDNNSHSQPIYRKHLPLQLAWALSVHKSQGMTISNGVEISLSKIFETGQAYVALSRSTSLNKIKLIDFNVESISVDQDALDFYKQLNYI